MIRTALEFLQKELESFMVMREQDASYTTGSVVDLKSIILPNGTINITASTHITLMLVSIEEERREGKRPYYIPKDDKNYFRLNPPVELDVCILLAAHNSDYQTALRDLSDVISFFQANPVFTADTYPALNASVSAPNTKPWQLIERLSFMLHNMTLEQQNFLWAMIGHKYIPSAVYRMKMLTFFETRNNDKIPAISELNYAGGS